MYRAVIAAKLSSSRSKNPLKVASCYQLAGGQTDGFVRANQQGTSIFGFMYGYNLFGAKFQSKSTGNEDLG